MSTINRLPIGLQSFLDSKSLGDNPNELGQLVAPVVELGPFYYGGKALEGAFDGDAGVTNIGFYGTITVPAGEVWALRAIMAEYIVTGAGTTYPILWARLRGPTASMVQVALTEPNGYPTKIGGGDAANEVYIASRYFEEPFLVPSDYNLETWLARTSSGATVTTRIAFYRLTV